MTLKINATSGYVLESTEPAFPEILLDTSSHDSIMTIYSYKNYCINGWFLASINDPRHIMAVDNLQKALKDLSFKNDKGFSVVFNTIRTDDPIRGILNSDEFGFKKIDCGRNMILVNKSINNSLKNLAERVGQVIRTVLSQIIGTDLSEQLVLTFLETEEPRRNILMGSMDNVPDQLLHSDVQKISMHDTKNMYIGILATQNGPTQLRVLTASHDDGCNKTTSSQLHRLVMTQYQIWVGHPQIIHGGCSSCHRNTRLHFYYDLPKNASKYTHYLKTELDDKK